MKPWVGYGWDHRGYVNKSVGLNIIFFLYRSTCQVSPLTTDVAVAYNDGVSVVVCDDDGDDGRGGTVSSSIQRLQPPTT